MGLKKTHQQFLDELSQKQVDVKVLELYSGSQVPISCQCNVCGNIWRIRPNNLLNGHGCPTCSIQKRAASQTKDHEAFSVELKQINPLISLQEAYKGSHAPIACKCITCGHIWKAAPTNLLKGKGCPKCAHVAIGNKKRRSHSEFLEIIKTFGHDIEPLEEFKGNALPISMKCNECGYIWTTTASNIVCGRGCPKCAHRVPYSQEEFVQKLHAINPHVKVLGAYKRSAEHLECECLVCGHIWRVKPNNLLSGKGCPACCHTTTSFVEQVIQNVFSLAVGENGVVSRNRTVIGKELDTYIPSLNLAIEPGSWRWHRDKIENDRTKRELCKSKGIRLITVYSDYDQEKPPFDTDCICVTETLGFENDQGAVKSLIKELLVLAGLCLEISSQQWKDIIKRAYLHSRRRSTDEFRDMVRRLHSRIDVIGEYTGAWNKIACICETCGHQWSPAANNLLQGHGCPKCADNERGLNRRKTANQFERELKEINNNILLLTPYISSTDKVNCKCLVCKHEWSAFPGNLLKGRKCPNCSKLEQSKARRKSHQDFVEEVTAVNGQIEILGQYAGASRKIECKCLVCGHLWEAIPTGLLQGRGCPQCAHSNRLQSQKEHLLKRCGTLQEVNPVLAVQWHPTKNGSINPQQIVSSSSKKAWWFCPDCGHEWQAVIDSRNRGHGCPACARKKK